MHVPTQPADSMPAPRLFTRCLFCRAAFAPNVLFGSVPPGRLLAFDPRRTRLWSICERCRRWNLIPADERHDAIDTLEETVARRALRLAAADDIALFEFEDLLIVRIGAAATLGERIGWRYGGALAERTAALGRPSTRVVSAVVRIGQSAGVWAPDDDWGPSRAVDVLRWSRFGRVAWGGRSRCAFCSSVLHTLHFDASWWFYPRIQDGELVVGVPCTRCDPWTPRNVFDVTGDQAFALLRRVLAWQHVAAAPHAELHEAVRLIQRTDSPVRLVNELSTGSSSLWRLGRIGTIALEIALDDIAERMLLDSTLHALAAEWRAEDELAAIVDAELS
jgi:hypothetical protein